MTHVDSTAGILDLWEELGPRSKAKLRAVTASLICSDSISFLEFAPEEVQRKRQWQPKHLPAEPVGNMQMARGSR